MVSQQPKPTIVITGGNFVNKGAESMLMSTVDAVRTYFPGYEPVLLDLFPTVKASDKGAYPFRIVNMHVRTLYRMGFPILKLLFKKKAISDPESEIKSAINSASAVFDISGYGLSSHNQALMWSVAYLLPIYLARKKGIPVWLLPQSMGPFHFKGLKKWLFQIFAVPLLRYPKIIFVREPAGLKAVRQIRKEASELSADIVLQVPEKKTNSPVLAGPGVLVIPNQQLFRVVGKDSTLQLFENLIRQALDLRIPVRIIQHSRDDRLFCELLKSRISHELFKVEDQVLTLEDLHTAIRGSRFVVSGRYHGAIHALKLHKPVIIVGWAEKYRHLATMFSLEKLLVDVSSGKVSSSIDKVVKSLITEEQVLVDRIEQQICLIEQDNVWKRIQLK